MKTIFVVFSITQNGKKYAIADSIKTGENILAYCLRYNADVCHLCGSRRESEQLAENWNNAYKENGTNLF